jgi:hypothetical protein
VLKVNNPNQNKGNSVYFQFKGYSTEICCVLFKISVSRQKKKGWVNILDARRLRKEKWNLGLGPRGVEMEEKYWILEKRSIKITFPDVYNCGVTRLVNSFWLVEEIRNL